MLDTMTQEMPYTRDTSKLEIGPSLYTFPGDENVSREAYNSAMKNTYLRKVPFAAALMENFNIPFNEKDHERTKRVMVCMGWLDHLLDEAPDRSEARKCYDRVVSSFSQQESLPETSKWVRSELRNSVLLTRNALASLPSDYVFSIIQKALRIGEISSEKATSRHPKRYATSLMEEGSLSSDVVIECLSEAAKKADGYQKLYPWNEKAMAIVVKSLPNTSLHIFGDGSERANLEQLITDLRLEKHVFLDGFSDNVMTEYLHADLSLFTSHSEGFGLAVLESLSQGCPVVSYDLPYGPSDMIIDGKNGYLVERSNIDMLAAKVIEALSDKKALQKLSKAATKSVDRFNEKNFTKKWVELFNDTRQ